MTFQKIQTKHIYLLTATVLILFVFLLHIDDLRVRIITCLVVLLGTLALQFYFFTKKIEFEKKDREKAADLLNQEKEYYNSFVDSMIDWVWEVNLQGTFNYSNKAIKRMLGYSSKEIIGKKISDLWYDYDKTAENYRILQTILSSGKGLRNYRSQYKHKNGPRVYVESMLIPVFDEQQQLRGYRGVARDITKRITAEKSLQNSEKRFRDLTDLLPQTICEMNEKNTVMFLNKTGYGIFGYEEEDINIGLSSSKFFVTSDYEKAINDFKKVMNGGNEVIAEYTAVRKDGTQFPVIFYIAPMISENRIEGTRGIIVDITKQKNAEQQLKQSYRELKEAQGAIIELERKNTALAMGVTANHEINQPLYVVKMNLGMLSKVIKRENQEEKYLKFLTKMDKALLQIQDTLNKYKDLDTVSFEDYNEDIKMLVINQEKKIENTDKTVE